MTDKHSIADYKLLVPSRLFLLNMVTQMAKFLALPLLKGPGLNWPNCCQQSLFKGSYIVTWEWESLFVNSDWYIEVNEWSRGQTYIRSSREEKNGSVMCSFYVIWWKRKGEIGKWKKEWHSSRAWELSGWKLAKAWGSASLMWLRDLYVWFPKMPLPFFFKYGTKQGFVFWS